MDCYCGRNNSTMCNRSSAWMCGRGMNCNSNRMNGNFCMKGNNSCGLVKENPGQRNCRCAEREEKCGCERKREEKCGCGRKQEEKCGCGKKKEEKNYSCGMKKEEICKEKRNCSCEKKCPENDCSWDRKWDCYPARKDEWKESSVGMAYVPWQAFCNLHDIGDGFREGTIFKELEKPFEVGFCARRGNCQ